MRNLKFAFRTLFKTPFVTIIAIVSLALGIGAKRGDLLAVQPDAARSLPVPRPARLVNLAAPGPKPGSQSCDQAGDCDVVFSYAMFRDLQKVQTSSPASPRTGLRREHRLRRSDDERRGAARLGQLLSGPGGPAGARPAVRFERRSLVGEAPVVVLSHAFWPTQFGADPNVLNKTLMVNGQTLTIVGVAARVRRHDARREAGGLRPDHAARPMSRADALDNRTTYWAYLFARLARRLDRAGAPR